MTPKEIEVSVIIPTLNEEETIGICIEKVKRVFEKYNINGEIIVSDSSNDNTPIIARSMGAIVVTPDRRGYGYAYRYAFRYAKGKYIVIGDGDDTYDFSEIPKLLEPLIRGEADLVIGSRFKGRIEKGAMPLHHRYIGNPLLTFFLNLFFKAGISDAHSGFRAIRRDVLEKLELKSDGMEFASEMIVEACRKNLKIKEVPINYYRRKNPTSKLRSFQDGWRHMKFMLLNTPDFLFIYPGITIFLVGIILMLSAFFKIFIGYLPGAHSIIAGSLLITTGYQVTFFGSFAKLKAGKTLPKFLTLEKGATLGMITFLSGVVYALILITRWIDSNFEHLPAIEESILAFTLIALGLQTYFSAFMLSMIAERT
ncbi:MAG: glycosyltransferase family 2 protein [Saccharolobus sp.]|uniref:glycosyltransferase family 2 protein n=1 Tax=Saccharolobus sp. TaxID=2100761 RepID=UPI00316E86AA